MSTEVPNAPHVHTVELTMSDVEQLKAGKYVKVATSTNAGHSHQLVLEQQKNYNLGKPHCNAIYNIYITIYYQGVIAIAIVILCMSCYAMLCVSMKCYAFLCNIMR